MWRKFKFPQKGRGKRKKVDERLTCCQVHNIQFWAGLSSTEF